MSKASTSKDPLSDEEMEVDSERLAIREEISNMSIEEMLALKEEIGSKLFDQSLGLNRKKSDKEKFRRENKNRPRMEPISKKPVKRSFEPVGSKPSNKRDIRDPRFDPLCGEYDEKVFKQSYKFVDEIKTKELSQLKKQLKSEEDPEKIDQLKYLIQRMENQSREKAKIEKQKEAQNEERKRNRDLAKEGKAPVFMNKTDRKKKELVEKFEELKKDGKIDQYLKKKAKKNESKDRRKLSKLSGK